MEEILPEKDLGNEPFYGRIREKLSEALAVLSGDPDLITKRYDRFRKLGVTK